MTILASMQVGSRVTCSPPPTDTDNDILILVSEDTFDEELKGFQENGFTISSNMYNRSVGWETDFISLRKDELNYIVTKNQDYYNNFVNATRLAKELNLLEKKDRVALFEAILYGRFPHNV